MVDLRIGFHGKRHLYTTDSKESLCGYRTIKHEDPWDLPEYNGEQKNMCKACKSIYDWSGCSIEKIPSELSHMRHKIISGRKRLQDA